MKYLRRKIIICFCVIASITQISVEARRQHSLPAPDITTLMAAGLLTLFLTEGHRPSNRISGYHHKPSTLIIPVPIREPNTRVVSSLSPRILNPYFGISSINFHPRIFSRYGLSNGLNHKYLNNEFTAANDLDVTDFSNTLSEYSSEDDIEDFGINFNFDNLYSTKLPSFETENDILGSPNFHLLYKSLLNNIY